jgi:hypothetical protein
VIATRSVAISTLHEETVATVPSKPGASDAGSSEGLTVKTQPAALPPLLQVLPLAAGPLLIMSPNSKSSNRH